MKSFILSLIALFTFSTFAASPVGKYTQKHDVVAMMNDTAKKCKAEGGKWDKEGEMCLVSTSDDAEVTAEGAGYILRISTVATNFHSCEFEGRAKLVGNKLISKVPSEEYNYVTDTIETVTCVLTADLTNKGKTMTISTNDKCRSFCGANGWLDVTLKKVRK